MKEDNDCLPSIAKAFSLLKLEIFSRKSKSAQKKLSVPACEGAWGWWRRGEKSFEGIFLPEKTFSRFAKESG
ncbi:MAG: hypothetical protein IJQ52_02865 [Bacteroidales bacterium]|nr:hypothetical protein [Bacteroidales bacterium]